MSESGNNRRQSAEDELYSHCQSESLSEDGLREIIEQFGLSSNNNYVGDTDYAFFFWACANNRFNEGIIQCLLEYFPAAASDTDENGWSPLHFACRNPNVTPNIMQLLIDAAPDSVRCVDKEYDTPLHHLCMNEELDETPALGILKLLILKQPEAIRHSNNEGCLPIHCAAGVAGGLKSPEFCRVLIESYPGSERIGDVNDALPLHHACGDNTLSTVEYLYKLYPDAINHASTLGHYPIHYVITDLIRRTNPTVAVDIVKFLLDCNPNVKLQMVDGLSLLYFACLLECNDLNTDAVLGILKTIYDANPEAIEDINIASSIYGYHPQVQAFINDELVYVRRAKDHGLMTTPVHNGQLPLHTALCNNVRLGSIKLLVKGNPSAVRSIDDSGRLPLHVACANHKSASVVQYLLGLAMRTLRAVDYDNNTALHYACRGAKYDTIAMLLEKYGAVSVSKGNAHGNLPIDLLWESNAVEDRESVEYMESVFRLLKAYPETVIDCIVNMKQQIKSEDYPSQDGKKRKYGNA
eukprot:scaffold637_cov173-Skeletonema_marinoi.AAC.8